MRKILVLALTMGVLVALLTTVFSPGPAAAWTNAYCKKNNATTYYNIGGYATASQNAINDWKATATPLAFSTATNAELYIDVGGYGASGWDAITHTFCGSNGVQTSASSSYYNSYYTANYASAARRSVMVHEIGHAMGIDHAGGASCSGQPIMYYSSARYFTCKHIVPQQDDVNGINAIY